MSYAIAMWLGMATQALIAGCLGQAGLIKVSAGQQLTAGLLQLALLAVVLVLRWLFSL